MFLKKPRLQAGALFKSGEKFPVTGYYSYADHVGLDKVDCYVSPNVKAGMLFTKGELVPKLIACPHVVSWRLDASYKSG
ncbi:MAG: hypothetical protein D9C04_03600 [Nitrosopumilus sp. B06]|nr:MAG: hypothetical protein D9C04_03600 [Nitrosopumilus sp. B06]